MKKVYFATTNEGKLKEAREILGIDIEGTPLEIDEIQSMDPEKVAVKKARSYYEELKKPLFVEDVSMCIEAWNGLPGTYIDTFLKTLGNEGIIKLLAGETNRKAFVQTTVVYIDEGGDEKTFVGRVEGTISEEIKGAGFGFDPIFIPGSEKKTFGEMEMEEKNKYSMRGIALRKFKEWLQNN